MSFTKRYAESVEWMAYCEDCMMDTYRYPLFLIARWKYERSKHPEMSEVPALEELSPEDVPCSICGSVTPPESPRFTVHIRPSGRAS